MVREKRKAPTQIVVGVALLATLAAATPVRRKVDPKELTVDDFEHVEHPSNGAVKQYPDSWTTAASRRGKWHISLRHKPNLQKGWQRKKNLHRLKDGEPYETEAEARKQVLSHMMILEGFEYNKEALKDGREPVFYESPRMVKARTSAVQEKAVSSMHETLDAAQVANELSFTSPTATAASSSSSSWTAATPVPRGRPNEASCNPVEVLFSRGKKRALRPQHTQKPPMSAAELAKCIQDMGRKGPRGKSSRRPMNHKHGGRSNAKRALEKALAAKQALERQSACKAYRDEHIARLDDAVAQNDFSDMLLFSERLQRIAGEDESPIMSEAQEIRVRNQCIAVANYFECLIFTTLKKMPWNVRARLRRGAAKHNGRSTVGATNT